MPSKGTVGIDGIDADGKAFHSDGTGKFDGKDYPPVTGDLATFTLLSPASV